ncbi:hypothetical protein V6N13_018939 [Hibiscus sabdariffa]
MSVSLKFSTASVSTTNQLNGRPSDDVVQVDTPRMLERLASPVDPANLHESKKVKSDNPSGDSGVDVCDMEADVVPEPASLRTVPLVNEGIDAKFDGVKNKASVEVHESIGDHDNWKDFLMSAWDSESDLPSALNDMKPKMVSWNQ